MQQIPRQKRSTLFVRVNLEKVQGGLSELLCFPSTSGMFCIERMDMTPGGLTPDMSVELEGSTRTPLKLPKPLYDPIKYVQTKFDFCGW